MKFLSAAVCLCTALVFAAPPLHAAPSKAGFVDRLQLIAQLRAGEYQAMEDRLVGLQDAHEKGAGPEDYAEHAYSGFAVSGPELAEKLSEWVRRFPNSYAALTARALYHRRLGWLLRRGRYAYKTRAAQFRNMRAHFNIVKRDLKAALAINGHLTVAYGMLINIAVIDGTAEERRKYVIRGLKADPASRITLFTCLFGLMPQWHGSLKAMRQFVGAKNERRKTNPKIPRIDGYIYRTIARRHKHPDRVRQAIDALTGGLQLSKHWRLYWERGDPYQQLDQHKNAVKDYTSAHQISPDEAEVLINHVWSQKVLKLPDRAT